jgi:hypothetical protein
MSESSFQELQQFLSRVPAIQTPIATGYYENGLWWIKFRLDIQHKLAWHVVQEFGCILNYLSINERLPTVFYPLSPAPYLNGGPVDFLSWIIENKAPDFTPTILMEWLEGRLPQPVDYLEQWSTDEDEDEADEGE